MSESANTNIAALATAVGQAGVAVIRISGPQAAQIGQQLTTKVLSPRQVSLCDFLDSDQQPIDSGIGVFFKGPHSFTGEDLFECHCHGSPIVIEQILQRLYQLGAEPAQAGEFSQRAFVNGKMDLLQAEAIMDLIQASSVEAAQAAQRSMAGQFSDYLNTISSQFIQLRANIELSLDFPDEQDQQQGLIKDSKQQIRAIQTALKQLIKEAQQGKVLTEATRVAIIGEPNVGKSTLLNALIGEPKSIVSAIAGTTRDLIEAHLNIDGIPIKLVDTAGIQSTKNVIEQEGIRRTHQAMQQAELILWLTDNNQPTPCQLPLTSQQTLLTIYNKCDQSSQTAEILQHSPALIRLSAKYNQGIGELKKMIFKSLNFQHQSAHFSAKSHHLSRLSNTLSLLQEALDNLQKEPELSAESIKLAHQQLQHLSGTYTSDDLLAEIFANFCIGK